MTNVLLDIHIIIKILRLHEFTRLRGYQCAIKATDTWQWYALSTLLTRPFITLDVIHTIVYISKQSNVRYRNLYDNVMTVSHFSNTVCKLARYVTECPSYNISTMSSNITPFSQMYKCTLRDMWWDTKFKGNLLPYKYIGRGSLYMHTIVNTYTICNF